MLVWNSSLRGSIWKTCDRRRHHRTIRLDTSIGAADLASWPSTRTAFFNMIQESMVSGHRHHA
eukprot:2541824-Rhodomonas_salina.6